MSVRKLWLVFLLFLAGMCAAQDVPRSSHVWMITEENHSYEDVVDNTQMPYYNHLIQKYGLATQFYADQHSSLPALMWLASGAAVELDNDTVSCHHSEDNIVRELLKQRYRWRSYQTNMPYAGFEGLFGGLNNTYYRRHNPLYGNHIDATYNLASGTHTTTALDLDSTYKVIHQTSVTFSVQPLVNGLQVISPVGGSTVNLATVHVVARANESATISQLQVWDNGVKLGWYTGVDVNQYYNLAPGTHTVTILDLDGNDKLMHQTSVTYTVQ